ncbi:MAG: TnpV protein [Clostridia bacterium]|nr:TnpV protein [Clostridia bacterium]
MEKTIIDERTGWEYEWKGEQYYPTGRVVKNGVMTPAEIPEDNAPEEESRILGIWAQRHLNYIRRNKKSLYLDLYMSGRLNAYLAEINAQAEDLFIRTVKEMAALEGVTEKLKAEDQMEWVGRMNNIRNRAEEIVSRELIFAS